MVRQGDRVIPLTRIEYDLLLFLAERPHRVFTRLQLLASVWGYEHAVARTVDVHVRRLRAKLGRTPRWSPPSTEWATGWPTRRAVDRSADRRTTRDAPGSSERVRRVVPAVQRRAGTPVTGHLATLL